MPGEFAFHHICAGRPVIAPGEDPVASFLIGKRLDSKVGPRAHVVVRRELFARTDRLSISQLLSLSVFDDGPQYFSGPRCHGKNMAPEIPPELYPI